MGFRVCLNASGDPLFFPDAVTTEFSGNGSVYQWSTASTDATSTVHMVVIGSIDFSGYLDFSFNLSLVGGGGGGGGGSGDTTTLSFELLLPANPDNLLYAMGLGMRGGYISKMFESPSSSFRDWKWDGVNGNNGVWLGSTTGGVTLKLKGEDPLWQASVPYDDKSSPAPPPNWYNFGSGGISLDRNGTVSGYSGSFPVSTSSSNATKSFVFKASLVITPVHNLNLTHHFSLRYVQLGYTADTANYTFLAEKGASVVNVHQGNAINPWINYPYKTNGLMNATSAACHALGMKFSIYNTMRELSNRAEETFAMRAMGEAYVAGASGGADWLKEHVGSNFLSAWSTPIPGTSFVIDAAMRVVALSRWNNYYVEGIQQMMRDFDLDGI